MKKKIYKEQNISILIHVHCVHNYYRSKRPKKCFVLYEKTRNINPMVGSNLGIIIPYESSTFTYMLYFVDNALIMFRIDVIVLHLVVEIS